MPALSFTAAAAPSPGWQGQTLAEHEEGVRIIEPQVAVDGAGNAYALWHQTNGTRIYLWSSTAMAGGPWGEAVLVAPEIPGNAYVHPQIVAGAGGDVFAIWDQTNSTDVGIWSNRYIPGWGWGSPSFLGTGPSAAPVNPDLAVDSQGRAYAVWVSFDGAVYSGWANVYTPVSGWGRAELIEADDVNSVFEAHVGTNDAGEAFAVFSQSNGTRNVIWGSPHSWETGWGRPVQVEDGGTVLDARNPRVAVNTRGEALAVWQEWDGATIYIAGNRYDGSQWGKSGRLETDAGVFARNAQVAFDASGAAFVVWAQQNNSGYWDNVVGIRQPPGGAWEDPAFFQRNDVANIGKVDLAVNAAGDAVAVWEQTTLGGGRFNVAASSYARGIGWGAATLIETMDDTDARYPTVGISASGEAVAVWGAFDAVAFNVWANRFVVIDSVAPALGLWTPASGTVSNASTAWVTGYAEQGARVSVNGASAALAADGTFGLRIALVPGENAIVATAWDAAGNSASASTTVTFTEAASALESRLAEAQENLTAAQARLVAISAQGNATEAELDVARADLEGAQAALAAAQGRVTALENSAVATRAEVNASAAKSDLIAAQARIAQLESQANVTNDAGASAGSGGAGIALPLALAGLAVGAVGCMLALRRRPAAVVVAVPPAAPPAPPPAPQP